MNCANENNVETFEPEKLDLNSLVAMVQSLQARVEELEHDIIVLRGENTELRRENTELRAENKKLRIENAELRSRLGKNSSNSSKPPSCDGYAKPAPKSLREKSGLKPGGQLGHEGAFLAMKDVPDKVIEHVVGGLCSKCGLPLESAEHVGFEHRQVMEIPELPPLHVTEHRAQRVQCCCGHIEKAAFPSDVKATVQYGASVAKRALYLRRYQHLPAVRTAWAMRDLFTCPLSVGTMEKMMAHCAHKLDAWEEAIIEKLLASRVLHGDETGMRVNSKLHWLQVVSNPLLTLLIASQTRGGKTITEGLLKDFTHGTLVHDHLASYYKLCCHHAACNAHHLRELEFAHSILKQKWAKEMSEVLLDAYTLVADAHQAGLDSLPKAHKEQVTNRYLQVIQEGIAEIGHIAPEKTTRRGRKKRPKELNLLLRLQNRMNETLAFMHDFQIPFTNNLAERDIRMAKVYQKVSGCFRTFPNFKSFARIRSYLSTAIKNGISAWDALALLLSGKPFVPAHNTS